MITIIDNEPDIYFSKEYAKLYEDIEKGTVEEFKYEDEFGLISNLYIKRKIPLKIGDEIYYDITTPYGYGGPIIRDCKNDSSRMALVNGYKKAFEKHCENNNIVCEFIRFHPILMNHKDFQEVYSVEYMRKTLGTNLEDYRDPFQSEFSKSGRKTVRKALRAGVTYDVVKKPSDIAGFLKIYNSTMDRNDAHDFYYFGEKYFNNILETIPGNVVVVKAIYEEKIIAEGLYFVYKNIIHIHLSGTLKEFLHLSPAYILRYAITMWGKANGYHLLHHGGGRTNNEDDSLYRFKKRFANNTEFDFYVGKKIWNDEIYTKLTKLHEQANLKFKEDYFPAYRA